LSTNFQDPELMADAQRLTAFASAIAQSSMLLYEYELHNGDKTSLEYLKIRDYFLKNLPKFKEVVAKIEADLG
jgi:hypothetical protein